MGPIREERPLEEEEDSSIILLPLRMDPDRSVSPPAGQHAPEDLILSSTREELKNEDELPLIRPRRLRGAVEAAAEVGHRASISQMYNSLPRTVFSPSNHLLHHRSVEVNRGRSKIRCLAVDDSAFNLMTLELLLKNFEEVDMEVETAMNGHQGVQAVARNKNSPFDFILLDLQMPVLDGYGVSFTLNLSITGCKTHERAS